jgi:hypothetical protein
LLVKQLNQRIIDNDTNLNTAARANERLKRFDVLAHSLQYGLSGGQSRSKDAALYGLLAHIAHGHSSEKEETFLKAQYYLTSDPESLLTYLENHHEHQKVLGLCLKKRPKRTLGVINNGPKTRKADQKGKRGAV